MWASERYFADFHFDSLKNARETLRNAGSEQAAFRLVHGLPKRHRPVAMGAISKNWKQPQSMHINEPRQLGSVPIQTVANDLGDVHGLVDTHLG